jgi:hypothetical protein
VKRKRRFAEKKALGGDTGGFLVLDFEQTTGANGAERRWTLEANLRRARKGHRALEKDGKDRPL